MENEIIEISKDIQLLPSNKKVPFLRKKSNTKYVECSDYLYLPKCSNKIQHPPFTCTDYSVASGINFIYHSGKFCTQIFADDEASSYFNNNFCQILNHIGHVQSSTPENFKTGLAFAGNFQFTKDFYDANIKGGNDTLSLGYAPQSIVDPKLNETLDRLAISTGNKYPGYYNTETKEIVFNDEYFYNNEKYVKVNTSITNDMLSITNQLPNTPSFSMDQYDSMVYFTDIPYVWMKVEPIKWIVSNIYESTEDPDFPFRATLTTSKAYFGGIPYYKGKSRDLNKGLWQNSLLRALLNGYNNREQILNYKNGDPAVISPLNFDYKDNNILGTIFKGDISMTKKPTTLKDDIISDIKKKRNPYGVTIDEKPMSIDEQLRFYIDNHMSVMLHGKSGIGKSKRVRSIDPELTTIMLRDGMMPEEIIGRECPMPDGGTKWFAPSWYYEFVNKCNENPDAPHILFIDEYNNADEHTQSLVFDLIHNRSIKVNQGQLPDNASVVCAGNSREESQSAYNMTEPAFRRLIHMYLPLDVQSWIEWGSEKKGDRLNIHPLISNLIATYPKNLYTEYDPENPPIDNSDKAILDPRAWEIASDIIYNNHGVLSKELLANKVGDKNAQMLIAFAKKNVITIEDILNGEYDVADIPTKADEKYAMTVSYRYATPRQVEKVREFIGKYLGKENQSNFDYIWINNDPERAEIIEEIRNRTPEQTDEPRKIDMSQKKITIEEFYNNGKEKMAIHTDTQLRYYYFRQAFDRLGKTWRGASYLEKVDYEKYKENTCISNYGGFDSKENYAIYGTPVYEFDDVDFSGVLTPEELDQLKHKITIEEFCGTEEEWKSGVSELDRTEKHKCILVNTKEKYDWVCKAFDKLGRKWCDGSSFLKGSCYGEYKKNTCLTNSGYSGSINYYRIYHNPKIYNFDEIDFSGVLSPEEIKEIDELIKKEKNIPMELNNN